jgi:Ca2+-binding RTX toxin-like protein
MPKVAAASLVALTVVLGAAQTAGAQASDPWSCRASAARVALTTPVELNVEPVRANALLNPCSTQSAVTVATTTIGPITADAVGAFTVRGAASGGSSLASIAHPIVNLGALVVEANAVQAFATTGCNGTTPVHSGGSKVVELIINGNAITIPADNAPFDLDLGPLGHLYLNQQVVEGGNLIQRAVFITTPLGDVALAEAIAGFGPTACQPARDTGTGGGTGGGNTGGGNTGGGTGGSTAGGPNPCPSGAEYDSSRNVCVVHDSSGSGGTAGAIVVGRPFQGPSGGKVIALSEARRKYKSVCLQGAGPRYAIVGTNGNDKITGTNGKDRILLLAGRDKSEGGRGDDCIGGGSGVDTISGALGSDRLYGGSGNDHLIGGSQSDYLSGGSGNDTIHTGFGRDVVIAGPGDDVINAATAGPAARRLDCGGGFDKIRLNRNERGPKLCEVVHVVR